ncbi:hypothetical protein BBJ28_00014449 [Nothophytophthora sp. Chile5]|nr:hypothetical protein BBJ28_00014449 [Nothophytophthora sp. Chile5]
MHVASRSITAFFFDSVGDDKSEYKICAIKRRQGAGTGYSNLLDHLRDKHPDYQKTYSDYNAQSPGSFERYGFLDAHARQIFQWMRWVVMRNHVLAEVGNPLTREMSRLDPVSSKTLLKYMNKEVSMIKYLVGDNCSTNRSIATKMGTPLVGCASRRFNLAVQRILTNHESLLDEDNNLKVQLRHHNNSAELAKYTPLRPVKMNVTPWSSVYDMLARYLRIRYAAKKIAAVEDYVPRAARHRQIEKLFTDLKVLHSVTVALQSDKRTLADVRVLFDSVPGHWQLPAIDLQDCAHPGV